MFQLAMSMWDHTHIIERSVCLTKDSFERTRKERDATKQMYREKRKGRKKFGSVSVAH